MFSNEIKKEMKAALKEARKQIVEDMKRRQALINKKQIFPCSNSLSRALIQTQT